MRLALAVTSAAAEDGIVQSRPGVVARSCEEGTMHASIRIYRNL
jgi:hypothetical protein